MSARPNLVRNFVSVGLKSLERQAVETSRIVTAGRWIRRVGGALALAIPAASVVTSLLPDLMPTPEPDPIVGQSTEKVEQLINDHSKEMVRLLATQKSSDEPLSLQIVVPPPVVSPTTTRYPSTLPEINITAALPATQGVMFLAPQDRRWYRTSLGVGDVFWALPDADFKLTATELDGCPASAICKATLRVETAATDGPVALLSTERSGFNSIATDSNTTCQAAAGANGVVRCVITLSAKTLPPSTRERLCVWFRRPAFETQVEDRSTAKLDFELQWRKPKKSDVADGCGTLSD